MSRTPSKTQTGGREAAALAITPPQIVGPFYPVSERPDLASDLARPHGSTAEAQGQLILVRGRVLNRSGAPVSHARIDIWQANAAGKYRHPSDINPAPLDPNFKGFARLTTDASGHYSFRTIKPGRYLTPEGEVRPPHIHLTVEGQFDCLVTQLYFAGEGENATDRWLNAAPHPEQLIVTLQDPSSHLVRHEFVAQFDIVLANG
jgi:protocatechuate 3,4-dioxygenase, beta subunit